MPFFIFLRWKNLCISRLAVLITYLTDKMLCTRGELCKSNLIQATNFELPCPQKSRTKYACLELVLFSATKGNVMHNFARFLYKLFRCSFNCLF